MSDTVIYDNKVFSRAISAREIGEIVTRLGHEINTAYKDFQMEVILISILDGSFMFMADLVRQLRFDHHIHFVKLKSYEDTESTGQIEYILDLSVDVAGKHILVIEDIIDTGLTLESMVAKIQKANPLSVKICTLLSKPEVHNDIVKVDFVGKEIGPDFLIGYGLDINGQARNLPAIYKLKS